MEESEGSKTKPASSPLIFSFKTIMPFSFNPSVDRFKNRIK